MRDKTGLYAGLLIGLISLVAFVSIFILIIAGFRAFINYYKDFAVNIGIAAFTTYLLISDRKLKRLQREAPAYERRAEQTEKIFSRGGINSKEYREAGQKANDAVNNLRNAEGEKEFFTWLLAGFTIIAAALSVVGYFIDLFDK